MFAAEQVDGYDLPAIANPNPMESIEAADAFVIATGAFVAHGGTRAYYRPSTDSIQLPSRESFVGTATSTAAEAYYSTLLHELTHNADTRIMPRRALSAPESQTFRRGRSA